MRERDKLWFILLVAWCARTACQIQVEARVVSSSAVSDAAVSDTGALSAALASGMGGVYDAAGLPANSLASASVAGSIQPGPTFVGPPAATTTAAAGGGNGGGGTKTTTASQPTSGSSGDGGGGGGSAILIASLAVGVVGLVGVVAWAVTRGKGGSSEKPRLIPARIQRPPPYAPAYVPVPTAPPAPYAYPPPPVPAPVYAPSPPVYAPPVPPPVYAPPGPPPPARPTFRWAPVVPSRHSANC